VAAKCRGTLHRLRETRVAVEAGVKICVMVEAKSAARV